MAHGEVASPARFIPTPQESLLLSDDVELPLGYCLRCHKDVIVHTRLGAGARAGQLLRACLFCDEEILEEGRAQLSATVHELSQRGYRVVAPEAARLHKEGGQLPGEEPSAGGCGSCSSGGCGG